MSQKKHTRVPGPLALALLLALIVPAVSPPAAAQQAESPLERWKRIQAERQKQQQQSAQQQTLERCEKEKAKTGAYPDWCSQAVAAKPATGSTTHAVAATAAQSPSAAETLPAADPPLPAAGSSLPAPEPSLPAESGRYAATISPWSEPPDGPLENAARFSGRAVALVDASKRELTAIYLCAGDRPFSATARLELRGWTEALGPGEVAINWKGKPAAVDIQAKTLFGWTRNRGGSVRLKSFGSDEITGELALDLYAAGSNGPPKLHRKNLVYRAAFRAVRLDPAELSPGFRPCP